MGGWLVPVVSVYVRDDYLVALLLLQLLLFLSDSHHMHPYRARGREDKVNEVKGGVSNL